MRSILVLAVAGLALTLASAPEALAQGRGNQDRGPAAGRGAAGRQAPAPTRAPWEVRSQETRGGNGGGPAFCRSGEGHPVFGRSWCVEKGFGLGRQGGVVWGEPRWDDVVFRTPRRQQGTLRQPDLRDILGDVVFGRLTKHGAAIGAGGPLTGEWLTDGRGPAVLRIQAGGVPLAELQDTRGTGRADRVLLNMGR